ncbi:MAG TPA: IS630 family transposase, partial [Roseiflexaceae bacterium]|nr:IS630 family transposase [Roseiflexaceae bacterium]
KLDFRYTPKHGSWLNMAECEFAVLHGQCLSTRLASAELVQAKCAAWQTARNAAKTTVRWRFTCTKARTKLKRLYPS